MILASGHSVQSALVDPDADVRQVFALPCVI